MPGGCDLVHIKRSFTPYAPSSHFRSRILETIQSGFTISFNNTYFIQGFGNISVLAHNNRYAPLSARFALLRLVQGFCGAYNTIIQVKRLADGA